MRLHEQNRARTVRLNRIKDELGLFRVYLDGPKFRGHDPRDGLPNSYIATHEVAAFISRIRDLAEGFDKEGGCDGL